MTNRIQMRNRQRGHSGREPYLNTASKNRTCRSNHSTAMNDEDEIIETFAMFHIAVTDADTKALIANLKTRCAELETRCYKLQKQRAEVNEALEKCEKDKELAEEANETGVENFLQFQNAQVSRIDTLRRELSATKEQNSTLKEENSTLLKMLDEMDQRLEEFEHEESEA